MAEIIELRRHAGAATRARRVEAFSEPQPARDPLSLTWSWWRMGVVFWGSVWLSPFGLKIEPRDPR